MLAYQTDADESSCLFPRQTFDDECRARLPLMETSASCSVDQQRLSQWNIKMTLSEKKRRQMEGNGGTIRRRRSRGIISPGLRLLIAPMEASLILLISLSGGLREERGHLQPPVWIPNSLFFSYFSPVEKYECLIIQFFGNFRSLTFCSGRCLSAVSVPQSSNT